MAIIQQIIFLAILGIVGWLVFKRASLIRNTILLGRDEDRADQPAVRFATMLRIAFGQKKMFDRPLIGIMHFVVYAGFLLINIEVLEIVLDGIFGKHRLFAPFLGSFYTFLISFFEFLAVGVLVTCAIFLIRRTFLKVERFQPSRHREMNGWPQLDGKIILLFEIVLMIAILTMNATDTVLQEMGSQHYTRTGDFAFSHFLKPVFANWNETSLVIYERFAWWFHILGIFTFAAYVTYSKHLHIVLAFPNTYFSRLTPKGEMNNMPDITKEVKIMLGLTEAMETNGEENAIPERFGAKDVPDLSWKNLMDAYSCTECGRCTEACPANITGKKLSPRKIMMDTRDRLEDIGRIMQANDGKFVEDGKSLMGDYISNEEILACTTCNACVQECPILINPLDIILQLRRYKIMDEAQAPGAWNAMFQNLDTNQAPWKFSPGDRFNWADKLRNEV
ncbi:(Fe-S)-binding protein [Dyadobacter frigoris]|uniref:(Fe-S)-binding protein n=1 Tax=Dyadobacter frigoris TaxID=2576211 RepID=A0A4U6DC94_9BACT|nr:(Fe-S)-binding protein [Dyadobacter frigoris]TKT93868.1 (Fe-S)-binding protein [Dyadobacter frigoris]GLU50915.1 Fe-S oxidoreductase [Dyadobacter frigoris]